MKYSCRPIFRSVSMVVSQNMSELSEAQKQKFLLGELKALNLKLHPRNESSNAHSCEDRSLNVEDTEFDLHVSQETAAILKLVFPSSPHLDECCVMNFVRSVSSVTSSICSTNQDLSITQHQLVLKAVEVICALGVCPFLEKGVESSLKLKCQFSSEVSLALEPLSSLQTGTSLLFEHTKSLSDLIWSETCGHFVLNKFLRTYIAALLQLVFSPTCRKLLQTDSKTYDRLWCCNELEKVLKNVFKPLVFSQLFSLQGVRDIPLSKTNNSENLGFNAMIIDGERYEADKRHIAPVWFRNACGRVITDLTISDRQNGVFHLLETVLIDDGRDGNDVNRLDARAKSLAETVCTIPKNIGRKQYLDNVVPQIVDIISRMVSLVTPVEVDIVQDQFKKFSVHAVYILFKRHVDYFQQFVCPRLNILSFSDLNFDPGRVIIAGTELRRIVQLWDLVLFIDSPGFKESSKKELVNAFSAHTTLQILINCLAQCSSSMNCPAFLEKLTNVTSELLGLMECNSVKSVVNGWICNVCANGWFLSFELDKNGDICGIQRPTTDFSLDSISETFVKFLSHNKKLAASIFIDILKESISGNSMPEFIQTSSSYPDLMESSLFSVNFGMILKLRVLDVFLSDYGSLLLEDLLTFLSVSEYLTQYFIQKMSEPVSSSVSFSILQFLFAILFALAETKRSLSEIELQKFEEIEKLSHVLKSKLEQTKYSQNVCQSDTNISESLEAIKRFIIKSSTGTGEKSNIKGKNLERNDQICAEERTYLEAHELMMDPMLPIKAAGLRKVSKLVQESNKFALKNISEISHVILSCISDEDSYLFLSAVAALANIALNNSAYQIDRILELYSRGAKTSILLDNECVIKLGEVLTKFIVERGEIVVTERNKFLNSLLFNCRADKSDIVRASSISNLSKIVKELKFSIHLDVYEIVHMAITTIDGLLSYPFGRLEPENALHPDGELYENEFESTVSNDAFLKNGKLILKRSCIMLLSTLAELFPENRSHFEHILDVKTLKEIYHVLRKSYHTDSDYTCRLHAQNGLDEINKAMKSFWVNTNDDSTCKFSNLKVRGLPEL